jgi:hypothetical protein
MKMVKEVPYFLIEFHRYNSLFYNLLVGRTIPLTVESLYRNINIPDTSARGNVRRDVIHFVTAACESRYDAVAVPLPRDRCISAGQLSDDFGEILPTHATACPPIR